MRANEIDDVVLVGGSWERKFDRAFCPARLGFNPHVAIPPPCTFAEVWVF